MSDSTQVTLWLKAYQDGDSIAAQKLWEAYYHRLVGLARVRLQGRPKRATDEEDVALSAFNSFFQGLGKGKFPKLEDRDDLWRILVTLTVRKAQHQVRDEGRLKRGGGLVAGESALTGDVACPEPTPDFAAEVAEECERLLLQLPDEELRQIALWKMEGDTNLEVAAKLGCAPATVERRLALIRRLWEREAC